MTNKIYLMGGENKEYTYLPQPEWHLDKKAIILEVDIDKQESRICVEYISPPEVCTDDDPSITFKAGTLKDGKLYVPTLTEVLIYELPTFKQVGYVSLPCFNDIHHVTPTADDNLLVVSTGLDMVVEVSKEGERLQEWNVLGKNPWHKFSPNIDYRKYATTKPHESHPNYVTLIDNEIWTTRFNQKDAVCLQDTSKTIDLAIEKGHDGVVYQDSIYYTTINGYIIIADLQTKKIKQVYNLNEFTKQEPGVSLGWCRGIKIIEQNLILVAFSRLRTTKFLENIQWLRYSLGLKDVKEYLPTRIVLYSLSKKEKIWEYIVEDQGLNIIYSIN